MNPLFNLEGKVALVTGATRGIGRAIAQEMGRAGARVVISSEDAADGERVARELREAGIEASASACDVSNRARVDQLAAQVLGEFGRVDVLVCNAGVAPHNGPMGSATDEDWDLTFTINLRSMVWLTSALIPQMADRRDGAVILTSSLSGLRGNKRIGLYGLSKAGVAQLARNLAVEWGPRNVRVNAISPGVIRTEFARPMLDDPAVMEKRIALTPLRRIGEPHEIAGVAVMLASPAGAFITGQNLVVDGGTLIGDGS